MANRRSEPEPESAPGPWPPGAGAAQKSGGSATLIPVYIIILYYICILDKGWLYNILNQNRGGGGKS